MAKSLKSMEIATASQQKKYRNLWNYGAAKCCLWLYNPLEEGVSVCMKQIGNLAIICARRKDVSLRIEQGSVMVLLNGTYAPTVFSADWDDDETILSVIHELNFGRYTPKTP